MISTKFVLKVGYSFLFLVSLAIYAQAQDLATATIVDSQGSVQISRPDPAKRTMNPIKFRTNDIVYKGDVIKTGASGRLTLKLKDNSLAIVSENTTVEVKDTSEQTRTIFYILRGKTRIKIEKLGGKPNPYKITTPTTVIAVRGTIFDVIVDDKKTEVYVNEGEVSVVNLFAPTQEVILTPGNFTRVTGENPPRNPAQFSPNRNDKFFEPRERGQNNRPNDRNPNDKNPNNQDDRNDPRNNNDPQNRPNNPPNQPPPGNPGGPPQRPDEEEEAIIYL